MFFPLLVGCTVSSTIYIAHVPKSGGTVLAKSLKECGFNVVDAERTTTETPKITVLRDPLSHIPSMYAHCRAAKYSPHKDVPRGDNVSHGFNLWLDAALKEAPVSNNLHFGFKSCYRPWQFQTTFLGGDLGTAIAALDSYTVGVDPTTLLAHYNCTAVNFTHGLWPKIKNLTVEETRKVVQVAGADMALYAYAKRISEFL